MVIEGEIDISFNDEQLLNAESPISKTEEGSIISVNDEQLMNAWLSIFETEEGIVIFINELQPPKAEYPIYVTDGGRMISVNDTHELNVLSGIILMSPFICNVIQS